MSGYEIREFQFYLDAWKFCLEHDIPLSKIVKRDFKTWIVKLQN